MDWNAAERLLPEERRLEQSWVNGQARGLGFKFGLGVKVG